LQLGFHNAEAVAQYRRSLNLDEAIARVSFRRGATRFSREVIASHPDCAIAVRLSSNKPGQISFGASFGAVTMPADIATKGQDTLILRGHAYERMHSNGRDGVALEIRVRVIPEGGSVWPQLRDYR